MITVTPIDADGSDLHDVDNPASKHNPTPYEPCSRGSSESE